MSREKSDQKEDAFIEKLVSVRRVTKVVKGGKILRFSALVIVGDGKGRVGFATGKAREVPDAIKKAVERAKKSFIRVPLKEGRTLHHDIVGHDGAGKVYLRSAPVGTGIIAGGPLRAIFDALGMHDVVSKSVGSRNYHNMVRATFDALNSVQSPKSVATRLGKKLNEIVNRRDSYYKNTSVTVAE